MVYLGTQIHKFREIHPNSGITTNTKIPKSITESLSKDILIRIRYILKIQARAYKGIDWSEYNPHIDKISITNEHPNFPYSHTLAINNCMSTAAYVAGVIDTMPQQNLSGFGGCITSEDLKNRFSEKEYLHLNNEREYSEQGWISLNTNSLESSLNELGDFNEYPYLCTMGYEKDDGEFRCEHAMVIVGEDEYGLICFQQSGGGCEIGFGNVSTTLKYYVPYGRKGKVFIKKIADLNK